jgi:CheY-like chemotaxis protein
VALDPKAVVQQTLRCLMGRGIGHLMSIDPHSAQFIRSFNMAPEKKSILIVAHDGNLLQTRKMLLEHAGYTVAAVVSDDEAMTLLETKVFDLILLGRASKIQQLGLDQRLRQKYPNLLTLKIQPDGDIVSTYPSRITDAVPQHVVDALKEMLSL